VLRAFYLRRFFRIIPPLIPYLATIAIAGLLGILPVHMSEVVAAALFVANYFRAKSWFTVPLLVAERRGALLPPLGSADDLRRVSSCREIRRRGDRVDEHRAPTGRRLRCTTRRSR
jgi:hypothetical protein